MMRMLALFLAALLAAPANESARATAANNRIMTSTNPTPPVPALYGAAMSLTQSRGST